MTYRCRACGAISGFSSIEELRGSAGVASMGPADDVSDGPWDQVWPAVGLGVRFTGYTEIDWDSSTTVGWSCGCGAFARTLEQLLEEVPDGR